jgi:hypothetical protein
MKIDLHSLVFGSATCGPFATKTAAEAQQRKPGYEHFEVVTDRELDRRMKVRLDAELRVAHRLPADRTWCP